MNHTQYNDLQLICSLSTWRFLRKNGRSQSDILAIFCSNIINEYYSTISFELQDIVDKIKEHYGLEIHTSIVGETLEISKELSKHLNRTNNKYSVTKPLPQDNNTSQKIKQYREEYESFESDLQAFMKNKNAKLSQDLLLQKFNNYILRDDIGNKNDKGIYAYFYEFLSCNKDKYEDLLQTIKEGAILHEGLSFRIKKTKNKNKIILFLDTEILFDAMGYNGKPYQQKFDEFYDLVSQYGDSHLLMPLYYTEMVKDEIERMFENARKIKENNCADYRPTSVMKYLMENCKDTTDIDSKESEFFYQLKYKFKIKQYEESYEKLLTKYPEYNIESWESLDTIKQDSKDKKIKTNKDIDKEIHEAIKALSYINMIRRYEPKNLFDSRSFLLTDTKIVNSIARHPEIMKDKTIPLSNPLNFFAARLWEFLEVSLGKPITLKTQNPIFYLQIALKEMLNESILQHYDRAKEDYEKTKNKELLIEEIIDIKKKMELDPDIDIATIEHILLEEDIKEQIKIHDIEKENERKKGKEEGIEIGREEARKEFEEKKLSNCVRKKINIYFQNAKNWQKQFCDLLKRPKLKTTIVIILGIISLFATILTIISFFK